MQGPVAQLARALHLQCRGRESKSPQVHQSTKIIMQKREAKKRIEQLVQKYQQVIEEGKVKIYNEAQTRNEFIEPFFECLGWDMRNLHYEREVTLEENVSGGRVDLAFNLNNIPVMFLEVKPLKTDLGVERYSRQAINYAWNKGVTYAVLSDFGSIKVYNAEAESKRLLDKLIFEIPHTEYLSDFERIWLLSKESFQTGALEKYAERYGKMKKHLTVNAKLFDDLKKVREILTHAFGQWNETLSREELEEGVQKIIDRLVFIRVLEDRKLEPPILKETLRRWEQDKSKQFFPFLAHKFRELDDLYNSSIFQKHACETWEEYDNDTFKKVISLLYGQDEMSTYDFKQIPADILGGVYESYLGYIAQSQEKAKKIGKEAKKILQAEVRQKRKEQGIFYTPRYVVDFIVQETLGKKLQECQTVNELKKIKILDPACGSGSFLVKALSAVNDKYREFGNPGNQYTKSEILLSNIYGVDLDPQAVELAKLNLLIEALDQKATLPDITPHIREGNSLISGKAEKLEQYFGAEWRAQKPFNFQDEFKDVFAQGGFDVIIGNPPYVFARGGHFDGKTKRYYYKNFPLASYQLNTYLLFIDRAFRLLKKGGYFGFIIPNTWLTIDTFSGLRRFLLKKTRNLQIINIFDKVFGEANVDTCLLIFKKGKPNNVRLGEFRDGQFTAVGDFPVSQFKKNNYIINIALAKSKDKSAILDKIRERSKSLEQYSIIKSGFVAYETGKGIPLQTDEMKNDRIYHSKKKEGGNWYKYLDGKDVKRYQVDWSGMWVKYGEWLAAPRTIDLYNQPRILVRQIPSQPPYSINGVLVDQNMLMNDRNSMIVIDFKINPLYLLAMLNSRITTFWFINTFDKFQRKTFPQFKIKELAIFPIPNANVSDQKRIAKQAQTILGLHKELQATSANTDKHNSIKQEIEKLDNEIDEAIYKLYGLTAEEIKIIEQ